jgi:hypothetical protein
MKKQQNDELNLTDYNIKDVAQRVRALYTIDNLSEEEKYKSSPNAIDTAIKNAEIVAEQTFELAFKLHKLGGHIKEVSIEKNIQLKEYPLPVIGDIVGGIRDFKKYNNICKEKTLQMYKLKVEYVGITCRDSLHVLNENKLDAVLKRDFNMTCSLEDFSKGDSQIDGFWLRSDICKFPSHIGILLMRESEEQRKHWRRFGSYIDFTDLFEEKYKSKAVK